MAGFTTAGTPAMMLGAIFSSIPQQGKLNALICTETPRFGVRTCRAENVLLADRRSGPPSTIKRSLANSRRAILEKLNSVPIPPSMSTQLSARVAPVKAEIR